jgi:hypothetical protein
MICYNRNITRLKLAVNLIQKIIMNLIIQSKTQNIFAFALVGLLVAFISFGAAGKVFAQDDGGDYGTATYGDDGDDYGSATYSSDDYGTATYSPDDYGTATYSPDTSDYGTATYSPDDYGTATYSPNPTYSSDGDYSTGGGYSSGGGYSVTSPSYGSSVYSTPGLGGGYASSVYTTPGTGFASTPIYTPTPVTHTSTPAPIVYSTPVQTPVVYNTPVQTQTQTVAATAAQPIIINNNNTNTNTNTNVNTAPVTPVATAPVQYIAVAHVAQAAPYIAPSVSLTQIPYTGFDFGPIGDSIYWAALLAFAVAAAYLLVYYRGGAFTLATAMVTGRSSIKPMNFTEAEEETVAPVEAHADTHTTTRTVTTVTHAAPVAPVNARLASMVQAIHNLPTAEVRRMTSDAMIVNHSTDGSAPRIVITRG